MSALSNAKETAGQIEQRYVEALLGVLSDAQPDRGYFVLRPATIEAVRQALAIAGEIGDLVTFRVECPACGWRKEWEQYEREPGRFDGLCELCGTRTIGASPAVVRHGS